MCLYQAKKKEEGSAVLLQTNPGKTNGATETMQKIRSKWAPEGEM
jgi:hypothetical protein